MNESAPSLATTKLVRSLTEIGLPETLYKADLEVTDRYQSFSAELLRVSLLGMGVFGFLLKEVILNEKFRGYYMPQFAEVRWWFVAGLAALSGSAMFALAHRFLSSDCIAYQIRYLRLKAARDTILAGQGDSSKSACYRNDEMQVEKDHLAVRLRWGGHTLGLAALCLGIGVMLIAVGFCRTIFLRG